MKKLSKTQRKKRLSYRHKVKKLKDLAKTAWEKMGGKNVNDEPISLEAFTNRVKARMDAEGISPRKAVNKILNTLEFTDKGTRSRRNLAETLKKDYKINLRLLKNPKTNKTYRSWEDVFNNMTWDKGLNAYVINNQYQVVTTNSPKSMYLQDITTGERIFNL